MSEEQYAQEFECSFQAALVGSYFGKEISALESAGHISTVSCDPRFQVHTAWDLGIDDATAIWFVQFAGTECHVVDYYENSGCGLDHYARILREKNYNYGTHILPHDAEVKELGTGLSRVETLASLGINATVAPIQSVEDGINAARLLIPRCWFDERATKPGLEALRQYQREYDDKLKTFKNRPRHDWASHAADAFRYLAMNIPSSASTAPLKYNSKWVT